jgi:hypothetical protein
VQPRGGQAQIGGNIPVPSDGTTFSHNIKEDGNAIRTNGNAHAGSLRTRRSPYTNPMSKLVSPKTFQSNKSAKNLKNTSDILGLIIYTQMGSYGWYQEKDSGFIPLTRLPSDPLLAAQYKNIQTTCMLKSTPQNMLWNI